MRDENNSTHTLIDKYINDNPECVMMNTHTVILRGEKTRLNIYRLPLSLTFYNIKNGRFAAEYAKLVRETRQLDPRNTVDSMTIQKLLFEIDLKQSRILEKDIQEFGQREPGIITYDGYIINGNRRRSVLEELVASDHFNFKYIIVARLPPNVSPEDLWKIEAGIQLSRNLQLDYDPINELLKLKEGIDAGLSAKEIAKVLYGDINERDIIEKLEELKLIVLYLKFINEDGSFHLVKGLYEHFVDLRNIIHKLEKSETKNKIIELQRIVFQLIHDGIPHKDLRKLRAILTYEKTKSGLWTALEHSKFEKAGEKHKRKIESEQKDESTPARAIFDYCIDTSRILSKSQQPEKSLELALMHLENIKPQPNISENAQIKELIIKIEKVIKNLRNDIID